MKNLFCAALLLAGCAHAGELLPVQGEEAEAVQRRLDIRLRVRIIDGDSIAEKTIEDEAGNWKGTFRPGEDYDMLERVALKVAEFVQDYRRIAR